MKMKINYRALLWNQTWLSGGGSKEKRDEKKRPWALFSRDFQKEVEWFKDFQKNKNLFHARQFIIISFHTV